MILVLFADLRPPLSRLALSSLDSRETQIALTIPHAGERKRFVAGRHLLRMALTEVLGVDGIYEVSQEGGGKPRLALKPAYNCPEAQVDFSITHTENAVAVVVSTEGRVGLDIERRVGIDPKSIESALTCGELANLDKLPAAERPHACLRIWIEKEANAKLLGTGLDDLRISASGGGPEKIRKDRKYWTLDFGNETYELCLAYEGPLEADIRLRRETA